MSCCCNPEITPQNAQRAASTRAFITREGINATSEGVRPDPQSLIVTSGLCKFNLSVTCCAGRIETAAGDGKAILVRERSHFHLLPPDRASFSFSSGSSHYSRGILTQRGVSARPGVGRSAQKRMALAATNFTLNDQFRRRRACDQRANGGNVLRASACVDVEGVGTPRDGFTFSFFFFMVRNML